VRLLALRQGERDLHLAVLEIQLRRHQGEALLDGLANQLPDLVLVQQQPALPPGVVIHVPAVRVGVDVHVVQPHLAPLHLGVAVAQVRPPLADALHLGAEQRDAGLERLEDVVIVKRLAVVGNHRLGGIVRLGHHARAPASRAASRTAATRLP
jgi:hypothetical protein